MDDSETFIKMCSKAGEIQKVRPKPKDTEFYYDVLENGRYKPVWTPRQDQLQEMYSNNPTVLMVDFERFCNPKYKLSPMTRVAGFFPEEIPKAQTEILEGMNHELAQRRYLLQFTSMEQLWLAFVMREKFNKTWNGEEWTLGRR